MNLIRKIIDKNFTVGRTPWTGAPFIVLHTYNGKGASLFNWFNSDSARVSAHFTVLHDGTVEQYVELDNTAWANGNSWANANGVSIEHQDNANGEYTEAQLRATAELIKWVNTTWASGRIAYNTAGIKKHKEFADTGCPGNLPVDQIISYLNKTEQPPTNDKQAQIEALQSEIDAKNTAIQNLNEKNLKLTDELTISDEQLKGMTTKYNDEVSIGNQLRIKNKELTGKITQLELKPSDFKKFIIFGIDTNLYFKSK